MTVHKRDGRIIVDTIWPDGKRTRRQALTDKQANDLNTRIRASRIDGTWRDLRAKLNMEDSEGMTLEEAGKIYLEQYVKQKNRETRSKKSRLAILNREIGKILLTEIDQLAASKFAAKRQKSGVSARTINRDIAVLRHLLTWAMKNHLIESNALSEWDRLAEKPFEGMRPTEEIVDAVFEHLNETVKPLFAFLRYTGCRREEALSLKWSQINLKNQAVHLYRTKSGKPRSVPLTSESVEAIQAMPRIAQTEYVFYHPVSFTRWSEAKKPWNDARQAAGHAWLRIHDLRHAYAIRLVEAGVPLDIVSEMLGHHSVDFTKKNYAKYAPTWAGKVVLAALDGGKSESCKKVAMGQNKGKK